MGAAIKLAQRRAGSGWETSTSPSGLKNRIGVMGWSRRVAGIRISRETILQGRCLASQNGDPEAGDYNGFNPCRNRDSSDPMLRARRADIDTF